MSSLKKQKLLQINSLKAIHRGVEANVEAADFLSEPLQLTHKKYKVFHET